MKAESGKTETPKSNFLQSANTLLWPKCPPMSRLSDELRKRTRDYASSIVQLFATLPKQRAETQIIGRQLLRSGTSVVANFREASRARTNNEFVSKLEICIQEVWWNRSLARTFARRLRNKRLQDHRSVDRDEWTDFYFRHDGETDQNSSREL